MSVPLVFLLLLFLVAVPAAALAPLLWGYHVTVGASRGPSHLRAVRRMVDHSIKPLATSICELVFCFVVSLSTCWRVVKCAEQLIKHECNVSIKVMRASFS